MPSTSPDRQFGGTLISRDDARTCTCVFPLARLAAAAARRYHPLANRWRTNSEAIRSGCPLFVRETSVREQSRYHRGNVINPLAAGMYKSIGEPAAFLPTLRSSSLNLIDANCERTAPAKFSLEQCPSNSYVIITIINSSRTN